MLEETFNEIKFESKTSFDILVINGPNNVEQFNYNDKGYVNKLLDQDYVKIVNANSENFLEIITDNLCINNFNELDRNVDTHVIYEKSGYVYEIMHLYELHACICACAVRSTLHVLVRFCTPRKFKQRANY